VKNEIFTSVLGFDFNVTIVDNEGNPLKTGARMVTAVTTDAPKVGTKIGGHSWFTNYNDQLLQQIEIIGGEMTKINLELDETDLLMLLGVLSNIQMQMR
jgi:hypothetical protein